MNKLLLQGDVVRNLPEGTENYARVVPCETMEKFAHWRLQGGMACRYKNEVYVKVPQKLSADGEFSLDYDCVAIDEANKRIEGWNAQEMSRQPHEAAG